MSYSRWNDKCNWYIYPRCAGYISVNHVSGESHEYNCGENIDEFVTWFPNLDEKDKQQLRQILEIANMDNGYELGFEVCDVAED